VRRAILALALAAITAAVGLWCGTAVIAQVLLAILLLLLLLRIAVSLSPWTRQDEEDYGP
jgi:uncharacterized membrane protein YhiD involved in acid resistance